MSDFDDQQKRRHFIAEIDQAVRVANRETINPAVPPINMENVLPFAVTVAKLRADYLSAAFKMTSGEIPSEQDIETLKKLREAYDEAREAFNSLMIAIEREYVDLAE